MCCTGAQWKREEVPDHKWDFVDVREFHNSGCMSYFQYCFLYVLVIKSVLVYASDLYTMVLLLASNHWAGSILESSGGSSAMNVPFKIGKWIFFGCIIFSFLLLAWEAKKSRAIIRSRDISYAFTNVMANNYYSIKSYDHFCFFSQINNSKKKKDDFAFFVFFTFKGWKRLLLADAPRQVINGITLYSFARSVGFTTDISKWYDGSFAKASVLISMAFTVTIWIGSFVLLMAAAFLYVPLLCYIQGNLKDIAVIKVDKSRRAGSIRNVSRVAQHAYPPSLGHHYPASNPGTAYAPSNPGSGLGMGYNVMNRWPSEREYSEKAGYAESIASTDHFISHQAPTTTPGNHYGQPGPPYGGRTQQPYSSHPLQYQFPPPVDNQSSLNRAPSYSSDEQRFYTDDKHPVAPYALPPPRSSAPSSDYTSYPHEPPPPPPPPPHHQQHHHHQHHQHEQYQHEYPQHDQYQHEHPQHEHPQHEHHQHHPEDEYHP
ncbi:uncharacterized protein PGTG_09213 [Puccinia graminis f. sp. tritici CRL 75-36-700-3]|uniref:Uncharacterized protein n=1 Tax=Puccinia graminis f. sp. tritici (strain CRL 75-36-700-3 / race SCCL) TaxID=418459 RepID=E3KFY9_PUCGT|nr:uncharacterized protein PGTG_09213 [Puccinia graminis f. sp. tritici CRL 75-36-700-3]EFP83260.2 hypothetical protein PGTG_09213 [Puccinia graminis f. sp. tritici CRL 75-36-700-3]